MTDAPTLAAWLLEQIAADEAAARAATPGPWWDDGGVSGGFVVTCPHHRVALCDDRYGPGHEDAAHIARHDPARVLARCEADRRIVERCAYATDPAFDGDYDLAPRFDLADDVLRALASVYADADGFREEWR